MNRISPSVLVIYFLDFLQHVIECTVSFSPRARHWTIFILMKQNKVYIYTTVVLKLICALVAQVSFLGTH